MYLEISARGSGKTTRMVQAIKHHVDSGGDAIVFVKHMEHGDYISNMCKQQNIEMKHVFKRGKIETDINSQQGIDKPIRIFVDECDWNNEVIEALVYRYHWLEKWLEGGYFCTSPVYTRSKEDFTRWIFHQREDLLLDLLAKNGGQYTSYLPMEAYCDLPTSRLATLFLHENGNYLFGSLFDSSMTK